MPTYSARRTLEGDPDVYFAYVSDPENLPRYFPRMTDAHRVAADRVETTASVDVDDDGQNETVVSEAEFEVDQEGRSIAWSAPGEHHYSGSLRLDGDSVELAISTEAHFPGMQDALDDALDAIARNLRDDAR